MTYLGRFLACLRFISPLTFFGAAALMAFLGPATAAQAAIVTVTTTADTSDVDGAVSLREAILSINGGTNLHADVVAAGSYGTDDRIEFTIPGTGVRTINVAHGGLPPVSKPVTIDGYSQPGAIPNSLPVGNNGVLLVELNGAGAGVAHGLDLSAPDVTVRGLVINRFSPADASAIHTGADSSGVVIAGNFIGVQPDGTATLQNWEGIRFEGPDLTIGGLLPADRNIISGSVSAGIKTVASTAGNVIIQGNYIGTNAAGMASLGNGGPGISIDSAPNATIGGVTVGAGNLISGNLADGIDVVRTGAAGVRIQGNYVGTNATGTAALGNGSPSVSYTGIWVNEVPNATIGGTVVGARNIVSGNLGTGITIKSALSTAAAIQGNYIGTDGNGAVGIPNQGHGIKVDGAPAVTIGGSAPGAGNVVSANIGNGIWVIGAGAGDAQVQGNYIGTNASGTAKLGNASAGIAVQNAPNAVIGGPSVQAGNVVSGNITSGIVIAESGATGAVLKGNRVGTNADGTVALGNGGSGIWIHDSPAATIGGTGAGDRNIISANGTNVRVDGDYLASGTKILGNYIGTDVTGAVALAGGTGISISAPYVTVGGTVPGARNLISGNSPDGINVSGVLGNNATILGNYIGTDADGSAALGNSVGINLTGAPSTVIGGTDPTARNVISGNTAHGVLVTGATSGLVLQGNTIGTNAGGTAALKNDVGIYIEGGPGLVVGGTAAGAGNLVSGNERGIVVTGSSAAGTQVQGNLIGTNASGTSAIRNSVGITVSQVANVTIGGAAAGARNIISGNASEGILVTGSGAVNAKVLGNLIGTTSNGSAALPNTDGVSILAPSARIGGTAAGEGNRIAFNTQSGVAIGPVTTFYSSVVVRGNSIVSNGGLGIDLNRDGITPNDVGDADFGANGLQNYPVLTAVAEVSGETRVTGTLDSTASAQFTVDFYANASCDASSHRGGESYLGSLTVNTDAQGMATFTAAGLPAVAHDAVLTATATDSDGNTSEFSACRTFGTPGVTVDPTGGLITAESGSTATFSVRLNSVPTSVVTIPVNSSDSTEGAVNVAGLTFSPDSSALIPQSVIVTGQNDPDSDGDVAYSIVLGIAVSNDPAYGGLNPEDVTVTNRDDDSVVCSPRPPVTVTTANNHDGRLRVTVASASSPSGAPNGLMQIQFEAGTNAVVHLPGYPPRTGPFTFDVPNYSTNYTFYLARQQSGTTHLPFRVIDGCANQPWTTFVGGGPSAF